ncbi:PBECR4 domain-containing protein [Streptococcus ovis]|uniref:PBECR4 domain-containing protein n=1 Tax=Streptococcus ovis TaxID=82806 RepID=UPI000362581B|nr:PBECR4 domain-containing protein [Streptococcus ovis]
MVFTKAQAKSLAILDVARSLGMDMKRSSHKEYYWTEHDSFKIDTTKNTWHWYSRGTFGDTINLVQEMRDVSYKEAMTFLETGNFPEAKPREEIRQSFRYSLAPYEQTFREARTYLKETRELSDETIDFFLEKGVLAQARRKDRDGFIEDVLVFKYLDKNQNIVGASLQGLVPYPERHEGKGYLKQIMYQSEGIAGLNVSIGAPERLVVAEAPIDLMSYYELHKDSLENVRLVAMEGLKEGVLSRYAMEALQERGVVKEIPLDYTKSKDLTQASNFLPEVARLTTLFHDGEHADLITLAVDQDKAGSDFIEQLKEKNIPVIDARPPKGEGQEKMDWNAYLQAGKGLGQKEKAPEQILKPEMDRSNGSMGSLQLEAEGSPAPVAETSATFEQTVTSHPTFSYPLLKFSTNNEKVQRRYKDYHLVDADDMKRLKQYAPSIQAAAQWYLNEVADSRIMYVFADNGSEKVLAVDFLKENFIHLTGIRPFEPSKTAADFLVDFAEGRGNFPNILSSHALKEKLQVLPMLEDILDSRSFVLNDLSSVEKLHRLDFSEAIKAKDEDFLLLFKDSDKGTVPASLMKLKGELATNVRGINEKVILGIYRERRGQIEQLSLNDDYIKDGGKQLLSLLQSRELDTFQEQIVEEVPQIRRDVQEELEEKGPQSSISQLDSDADGISDEEELKQGTNPHDFRSKPGSRLLEEHNLEPEEVAITSSSLAVADFIKNKDVAGLNRHLKEGIKDYLDSDKYKDYLTKMSQLNNYSSRNLRLILAQHPEATQVASFKQWKETFGRHVKKGEKSIRIFAPMTKIKKDENNQPILDKNGKPETVTFFGLVPVFDVSQTEGKEMPKATSEVKEQLTDVDYANLYRALMAIAKENNVTVRFDEMTGDKKGHYNVTEHQIVLRSNDMNKSQLIKTFIHETAHSELHHANNPQQDMLTRSTAELQAESVAYVVASYYGIDTSDYSFAYLAGWSDDKESLADLEAQLDIVQQEAKSLMVRMDQQLEQLRLAQEKQAQNQFEQKLQKFKDQSKQAIEEHKQEQKAEAHSKKEKGFSK